jgi:hypothetical protein
LRHASSGRIVSETATTTPNDTRPQELSAIRRMSFTTVCLILLQAGTGMAANLYVSIPDHPGSDPTNYFTGSVRSIAWVLSNGAVVLVIHVVFGFVLAVLVVSTLLRIVRLKRPSLSAWTWVGALMVIGAGFNGASFLDFNNNTSSFIMAVLGFASAMCYTVVLFLSYEHPYH